MQENNLPGFNCKLIAMKTRFKLLFCSALLLILCACEKLAGPAVDIARLTGEWQEYYDDPLFIMDGSVRYTVLPNEIQIHTYDILSDRASDWTLTYDLEKRQGKYTITLHYPADYPEADASFTIVQLTDKEMAWQRGGTTFSRGSYSADYMHFVNDRYWKSRE